MEFRFPLFVGDEFVHLIVELAAFLVEFLDEAVYIAVSTGDDFETPAS